MTTILVTGGAGFIGSHLCESLLRQGTQVVCLDNFCDFYAPSSKHRNISAIVSHPNFTLVEADIRDKPALSRVFADHSIDMVIHLAAMAGVRPSIDNPELYCDVNVKGTLNLLTACSEAGINKFIFASSSSVYGNNPVPFRESDCVDYPISPYAATKKAGELLCYTWHHLFQMSVVCLRFFTVYGPRQRPDLAIYKFTKLIDEGGCVQLFGDGKTARDYTYVDDIIDGINSTVARLARLQTPQYEIFNLGNSFPVSLQDMLNTIQSEMQSNTDLEYLPLQAGDVRITYADISKAKQHINYSPRTYFNTGIRQFVQWYRSLADSSATH